MNRTEKLLKHVDRSGIGIEVGPSHAPIAPKKDGFKVHIIDHADKPGLLAKYADQEVDLDSIEEVDFVWSGESYVKLTGNPHHYDWIIASHVVEHTPDLVGFLNECSAVLKDDGVLCLAVPDKRRCFDYFRPVSGLSKVIDHHVDKRVRHTLGTQAEFSLNIVSRGGRSSFMPEDEGEYEFLYDPAETMSALMEAKEGGPYQDAHAWCFVPHSFRLIIHDLRMLGLIDLDELDFFPSKGNEFHVILGRRGNGCGMTRLELLEAMEAEIKDEVPKRGIKGLINRVL